MASTEVPRRGEIWLTALGAARKGELGKNRPAIIMSSHEMLVGGEELVVAVPLSSSRTSSTLRPSIPATAGIDADSAAVPRAVRGVARSRLLRRIGEVDRETLAAVERALKLILSFDPR